VPEKCMGILLPKARAGRGCPGRSVWVSLRRRGRSGGAGKAHGYPLPKARAGRGCRQKCMGSLLAEE